MRCGHIYLFLMVIELMWSHASGIKWLALATSGLNPQIQEDDCTSLTGLARRQVKICRRNVEKMKAVREAAYLAINECQYQFRFRRWNCSFIDPKTIFGSSINHGTREAAFVHAISSAAVSETVTKLCSSGMSRHCGCDRTVRGDSRDGFKWAGCSDNIAYGIAFSTKFVDGREKLKGKHLEKGLVNMHNNKAGRSVVSGNMGVNCKCHGVSGSCEVKMCWRSMPKFRMVGDRLKDKFDGATEVEVRTLTGSRRKLVEKHGYKTHTEKDLVYISKSPDFCEPNPKTGALGTKGRLCHKTSRGIDGCDLLCCGRGYTTRKRTVIKKCNCKFHWCCTVECDKCSKEVEENFCR